MREALTGERVGQPLNRENDASRVPTFFLCAEGNNRRDRSGQMVGANQPIAPEISVLDYRKGFGHIDLVTDLGRIDALP